MAEAEAAIVRARRLAGVAAVHLVLAYAVTFPAAHHVSTGFFGTVRGDKYQFVWIFWWVRKSLVELAELPFWTSLQYHPTGVSLTLHDMTYFWSLLSVPLQSFLSPETVLNVFLFVSFPLNGIAFYALALHVSRSHWGAMAGSMVFAYCPYLVGRFAVSHPQYLGVFFIPLFLLCLCRYTEEERLRHLVWAGVWAGATSLISFYYGIALAFIYAAFLIDRGLRRRREIASPPFWRRVLGQILATGLPAAALTMPVILPGLIEIAGGAFDDRIGESTMLQGSADLVAYFVPDRGTAGWRGWGLSPGLDAWGAGVADRWKGSAESWSVYAGWVGWAAVCIAVGLADLRRRAWPWLALAFGALIVTLGPTLHVAGTSYFEQWMPAHWLQSIPFVSVVRNPSRFAVFVTLGTGMTVALAIRHVSAAYGRRAELLVALGCMLLTLGEFAPRKTFVFPRSDALSPFYGRMASDGEEYAVLNVPVDFWGARGGGDLYSYAQTVHQKPIVGGYVSREPTDVFRTLRQSPFLQAVRHHQYEKDRRLGLSTKGLEDMPVTLQRLGVRYVLVHRTELPKAEWERVTRWLESGPLQQVYEGRQLRAYTVVVSSP